MRLFHLVMFDVDGTLVKRNGIDDVCFSEAVGEVLGIGQIDTDWSHYSNVTDSGITSEIIQKNLTRRPRSVIYVPCAIRTWGDSAMKPKRTLPVCRLLQGLQN
jgi:hypothetical protein